MPSLLASIMPVYNPPEPYSRLMVIVLFIVIFFYGLVAMVFCGAKLVVCCRGAGALPAEAYKNAAEAWVLRH